MDKDFWMRQRALLIEQAKALAEQRAAVIGQYKAIERMLELPADTVAPVVPTSTLTNSMPYNS